MDFNPYKGHLFLRYKTLSRYLKVPFCALIPDETDCSFYSFTFEDGFNLLTEYGICLSPASRNHSTYQYCNTHTRTHAHTHTHTHTHMHTHVHIHSHAYTHAHIHSHTQHTCNSM